MKWSVDGFVGDVENKDVTGLGYAITKISGFFIIQKHCKFNKEKLKQ